MPKRLGCSPVSHFLRQTKQPLSSQDDITISSMEPIHHAYQLQTTRQVTNSQMLFEALAKLDAAGDLLVLDRGYVGNTMVAYLVQRGLGFCLRADACGWRCVADFLRSGASEQVVILTAPSALPRRRSTKSSPFQLRCG